MQPADLYRLKLVGDPKLSPDASTVAFTVTQADEETNGYLSAIWVVPADGSAQARRLTWSGKRDAAARWAPDGRRVAFVSNRGGDTMQLYVLPMDGGEAVRLTELDQGVGSIVWSPDGSQIAFVSDVRAGEEGPDPRLIERIGYKADGRGFVHDRAGHLFVVAADGSTEPQQLTDGDFDHASPAWSPDGSSIVVCAYRESDFELASDSDLYVVSLEGVVRRLTQGGAMFMSPSWSPDGATIAARVYPDVVTAPWNTQIALVDAASGEWRMVTSDLDMQCGPYTHPREPIWNGERLVFAAEASGNCHIYIDKEAITSGDFCVTDHDVVADTIVHARSYPVRSTELYNGSTQLTSFGVGLELAEPVRFAASNVEAWAIPPVGVDGPAPTLLFIHGGPFTQYGNLFFDEFQIAAGAGFGVIYANPRGSSGYGDDWGRAIRGPISGGPGWGTVDYDDLMAVVEEAVSRFDWVDGSRLGVLGGSYGGFMTAWIVGHTDRFKAACAERGIYNVMSSIGTSDGLWSSDSVWGGDPYEHEDLMRACSPITYADQMTTPLLLIHSDEDQRCPVEQAEQLFTRLRLLGRDVRFVRFPHGSHDLSRNGPPKQRVARFEEINSWFEAKL